MIAQTKIAQTKIAQAIDVKRYSKLSLMYQKDRDRYPYDGKQQVTLLDVCLYFRYETIKRVPLWKIDNLKPEYYNKLINYPIHDGAKVIAYVIRGYVYPMKHYYA